MSIISSAYVADDHAQADGRKYVMEAHTDSTGAVHSVQYLAQPGADYQAIASARAAGIEAALADAEAASVTNG